MSAVGKRGVGRHRDIADRQVDHSVAGSRIIGRQLEIQKVTDPVFVDRVIGDVLGVDGFTLVVDFVGCLDGVVQNHLASLGDVIVIVPVGCARPLGRMIRVGHAARQHCARIDRRQVSFKYGGLREVSHIRRPLILLLCGAGGSLADLHRYVVDGILDICRNGRRFGLQQISDRHPIGSGGRRIRIIWILLCARVCIVPIPSTAARPGRRRLDAHRFRIPGKGVSFVLDGYFIGTGPSADRHRLRDEAEVLIGRRGRMGRQNARTGYRLLFNIIQGFDIFIDPPLFLDRELGSRHTLVSRVGNGLETERGGRVVPPRSQHCAGLGRRVVPGLVLDHAIFFGRGIGEGPGRCQGAQIIVVIGHLQTLAAHIVI